MSVLTSLQNAFQSSPKRVPSETALALISQDRGRVGKTNVKLFRDWSEHSEWVRAAINIRKTQVAGAEWDITPIDPDIKSDVGLQRELRDRLEIANPKDEEFGTFIEKVTEDILVLDAGSIEIEPMARGEPLFLHSVDGGTIRVNALWDGTNPDEDRYFWYPDNFVRASWKNDEFIYIMETPRTNSVVGLSKLETLKMSIDSELEGHAYNARQVKNAAPDGLLHLGKGAKQENIDAFRAFWQAEQGRGQLAITGGTELPGFIKFQDSNKDAQFLEWQIYLVRKIAAVMGMQASDLGFGYDINRSTAEVQDQQGEDRGIRPLMGRIRGRITRGYVQHPAFGGPDNNLTFKWTRLNLKESLARAKVNQLRTAGMPSASPNQIRKENGDEPWGPEFDQPMMVTPMGAFSLMDLPTVREFMDSKKPDPPAGPPANVRSEYDAALAELLVKGLDREPPVVHIDKGAIEVNVGTEQAAPPASVTVTSGVSERVSSTEADFRHDALGRVVGKEERLVIEKTPAQLAREVAEAEMLERELAELTARAEAARARASDPGTRNVVRETDFITDDKGRIVGKKEVEHDAD